MVKVRRRELACIVLVGSMFINMLKSFFFFFQAEDGIRVTSVLEFRRVLFRSVAEAKHDPHKIVLRKKDNFITYAKLIENAKNQIGRASCRERV